MSQFTNPLVLILLEDHSGHAVTRAGRSQWLLNRQLIYDVGKEFSGESIRVPVDFVTDLASIPVPFRDLLPPDGPWAKAAVVHDFLYFSKGSGVFGTWRYIDRLKPYSRLEADNILYEAMGVLGIPEADKRAIYAGVRIGGGSGWGS